MLPPTPPSSHAPLHTPRLVLLAPQASDGMVAAVHDYRRRNARHLAPWDPPMPADHLQPAVIQARLAEAAQAMAMNLAWRWWLTQPEAPQRVIGSIALTGLERGPFQNAQLGYAIDATCQGQGLMHEALQAVIERVFRPDALALHRLQAAVRPDNPRSVAVLERLGFEPIGLARHYLFIDGAWRDHLLFQRLNPGFQTPAAWQQPA